MTRSGELKERILTFFTSIEVSETKWRGNTVRYVWDIKMNVFASTVRKGHAESVEYLAQMDSDNWDLGLMSTARESEERETVHYFDEGENVATRRTQ